MAVGGLYTIATRAPGTIITGLIYNADHQAHVDGRTAEFMSGYSQALGQMQIITDPFPASVESLASSLGGEFERLRFVIADIKKQMNGGIAPAHWYDPQIAVGFAPVGARVQQVAGLTVNNNSLTTIDFTGGTADFNTGAVWNPMVNPSRFTAPSTGKYLFGCSVVWGSEFSAFGHRQLEIGINGSFTGETVRNVSYLSAYAQHQAIMDVQQLTATDYVEFAAFQDAGIAATLTGANRQSIVGYLIFLGT
jgi:hypothetical protein